MNEQQKQEIQKLFSENLNTLMQMNHKQQKDLIEDLGYSRSAVSSWCNGTRMPKIPTVDELAEYFKVSRSDLIGDTNTTGDFAPSGIITIDPKQAGMLNLFEAVMNALENGSSNELSALQKQYREEKEKAIKDTLKTIEYLTDENIDELYRTICTMQSQNRPKKKLTAVFRPQNPNQPHRERRKEPLFDDREKTEDNRLS